MLARHKLEFRSRNTALFSVISPPYIFSIPSPIDTTESMLVKKIFPWLTSFRFPKRFPFSRYVKWKINSLSLKTTQSRFVNYKNKNSYKPVYILLKGILSCQEKRKEKETKHFQQPYVAKPGRPTLYILRNGCAVLNIIRVDLRGGWFSYPFLRSCSSLRCTDRDKLLQ